MGKVKNTVADVLVDPVPDRNANRVRVYEMDDGVVVIHFRNFKIQLLTPMEREEWRTGFAIALEKLREEDYFKNDL